MNLSKTSYLSKTNFDKLYYYLSLFFSFSMPLSRAAISFNIISFIVIWLIEGDFKRKYLQIKSSKFLVSLFLFYCVIVFSIFYSQDMETALNMLRLYSYWIVIVILATSLKKEYINHILTAFLLGMFVSEVIAYGVFFDLWEFAHASKEYLSPFMFHIDYSIFLAFTSILLFNRLISSDYCIKSKIFMLIFFLSTTGNLFLSIGRTGQVALIFAIIVMFFYRFRMKFKTILYTILSLVIIYSIAYNLSSSFSQRLSYIKYDLGHLEKGNFNTSIGIRVAYWIITWDIFKEHPFIGVGLGDQKLAVKKSMDKPEFKYMENAKEFMMSSSMHNQFLMVIVQLGIVGLVFMLYILYGSFKLMLKIDDIELRTIWMLFLVIYIAGFFTDPSWNKQFTISLWMLISGIFSLYSIEYKTNL